MKFRTLAAAAAAMSLATAPAVAAPTMSRAAAPVEAQNELGGSGTIIGILAVAAIIAAVVIAAGGNNNPISA